MPATTQPSSTHIATEQPQKPFITINDLPLEIFFNIILLTSAPENAIPYYDRLRTLRLVATFWSALIDDYPKFWTAVSSLDPEPVWRMALRKSKAAEIDVDAGSKFITIAPLSGLVAVGGSSGQRAATLIRAVVNDMPRVRSLTVLDPDFAYLVATAPEAPRLRSLHLVWSPNAENRDGLLPLHPARWAPSIRDLNLTRTEFIWSLEPLWSNLDCLRVNTGAFRHGLPMKRIFTILGASPRLRVLDINGLLLPGSTFCSGPFPIVRLGGLETLAFRVLASNSPFEALDSLIAYPTTSCTVSLGADDETLRPENLRSLGRFSTRILDGEVGRTLELCGGRIANRITMGGFNLKLTSRITSPPLNDVMVLTSLLEGLPPQRCSAVTTVIMSGTGPNSVLSLLPIVHSRCPNTYHLNIPDLTEDLQAALNRPNEDRLFPLLESLSVPGYGDRDRTLDVMERRLRACEAGEHISKLKSLNIGFLHKTNIDQMDFAEVDALFPKIPGDSHRQAQSSDFYPD